MSIRKREILIKLLKNRQLVVALAILCLVGVLVWWMNATNIKLAADHEFVIKSAENIIQPVENNLPSVKVITADQAEENLDCSAFASSTMGGWRENWPLPILMYHYIDKLPIGTKLSNLYTRPEVFEAQIKALKDHCYQTIPASDLGKAMVTGNTLPAKSIILTFDDGYEDMYTKVYPLLKKYNLKATMYVIVNALDTPGYLTKAQAREMNDSGYVEIASHTFNHPDLKKLGFKEAKTEIADSKYELEKILGYRVYSFAYPYGFFTVRDEMLCHQAGYLTCASTYPGEVQTFDKRFSLVRLRPGYRFGFELTYWLEQAGPKL